jgi:hypothetical protein
VYSNGAYFLFFMFYNFWTQQNIMQTVNKYAPFLVQSITQTVTNYSNILVSSNSFEYYTLLQAAPW